MDDHDRKAAELGEAKALEDWGKGTVAVKGSLWPRHLTAYIRAYEDTIKELQAEHSYRKSR